MAVAFVVIVVFALFGQSILDYLGITLSSMQVAGGLLLLLVAILPLHRLRRARIHNGVVQRQPHRIGDRFFLLVAGLRCAWASQACKQRAAQQALAIAIRTYTLKNSDPINDNVISESPKSSTA